MPILPTQKVPPLDATVIPEPLGNSEQTNVLAAHFRQSNLGLAVFNSLQQNPVGQFDPTYDPLTDPQYQENPEIVASATSPEQARFLWEDYQQTRKDQAAILGASSTVNFIDAVVATTVDIPTIAFAMIPAFSGSTMVRAAKSAGAFGSLISGSEAALSVVKGREINAPDIAYSAAAGAIMGAAFPWAGAILRKGKSTFQDKMAKVHDDTVAKLKEVADTPPVVLDDVAEDLSSAANPGDSTNYVPGAGLPLPQNRDTLIKGSLIKVLSKLSPSNLIMSPIPQVRNLAAHIGQFSGKLAGGARVPIATSTIMDVMIGRKTSLSREVTQLWKGHKKAGGTLSLADANREVGKAVHGIVEPKKGTPLGKAEALYRDQVYDPIMRKAVDSGVLALSDRRFSKAFHAFEKEQEALQKAAGSAAQVKKVLPSEFYDMAVAAMGKKSESEAITNYLNILKKEDGQLPQMLHVTGALKYGNTLYDKPALIADGAGWDKVVGEYLHGAFQKDIEKFSESIVNLEEKAAAEKGIRGSVSADTQAALSKLQEELQRAEADQLEATSMAADIRASIVNNGTGVLPRDYNFKEYKGASLHERTLQIPRAKILKWLNTDIRDMSTAYVRDLGSKVILYERFGTTDKKQVMLPIQEAWQKFIDKAPPEKRAALQSKANRDMTELSHIWDRVEGTAGWAANPHSRFTEAGVVLRALGLITKLGKLPWSAMNDVARVGMMFGQGPALKMAAKMVTDIKFSKMAHDDLVEMVGLAEIEGTRVLEMAELASHGGLQYKPSKFINARVPEFIRLTGMAHMNEWEKTWAGTVYLNELSKAIRRGDMKSRLLTDYGIGETQAEVMKTMLNKHGKTHKGVTLPNTKAWKDTPAGTDAANVMEYATRKAVDEVIVTPGVLDRWTQVDTEVGKTVFQFSSFNFASNNRAVIAGLTGHSAAFYTGVANMIFLGTVSWVAKQYIAGQGDRVSEVLNDPARLAQVAIQNTGLGHLFTAMELALVVGGMDPQSSQTAGDHQMGNILGPASSMVKDALVLLNSYSDGKLTARDAKAGVKFIPYFGLWQVQGIMSAFGVNPNQLGK